MDSPSQGRRVIFAALKVQMWEVRYGNEPCRKAFLTEQSSPVKGRLGKDANERWVCTGIDQRNPNVLCSEACSSYERGVSFAISLEIEVGAGADERVNQRKLFPFFQPAVKEQVRDVVEGMSVELGLVTPGDRRIGARGILRKQTRSASTSADSIARLMSMGTVT